MSGIGTKVPTLVNERLYKHSDPKLLTPALTDLCFAGLRPVEPGHTCVIVKKCPPNDTWSNTIQ